MFLLFAACPSSSDETGETGSDTGSDTSSDTGSDTSGGSDTSVDPAPLCTAGTVAPFGLVNGTDHFYVDTWYVPVVAGDVVRIWADNNAAQAGDIAAFAWDSAGALLGGPDGAGAWDNEWACGTATADAKGCPDVTYTATQDEVYFAVGVGAWSGTASPIGYCLTVLVNGAAADLSSPSGDESTVPWGT